MCSFNIEVIILTTLDAAYAAAAALSTGLTRTPKLGSTPASGVAGRASRPASCVCDGHRSFGNFDAPNVFREGAENRTRGGCVPINFGTNRGISQFRGEWMDWHGHKLMATYHPAYLLQIPAAKSEVWKDLQKVMSELGLQLPKKAKS